MLLSISCSSMYCICRAERRLPGGGRQRLLTEDQETAIVNMVIANNAIRLREIQRRIIEDQQAFSEIDRISISTIDRLLHRNRLRMKQVYGCLLKGIQSKSRISECSMCRY